MTINLTQDLHQIILHENCRTEAIINSIFAMLIFHRVLSDVVVVCGFYGDRAPEAHRGHPFLSEVCHAIKYLSSGQG